MRKQTTKKNPLIDEAEKVKKQVITAGKDISILLKKIKNSYSSLDPKTKKKVAAGIAGLGTVLAAATLYHKKKKQPKE